MYTRLVIDGNAVYEIDEECEKQKQSRKGYGGKKRGGTSAFGTHTSDSAGKQGL